MNKISNAIKCVVCKNVLLSPVLLPCGDSICKKHTIDAKGPIFCKTCDLEHQIPVDGGFPLNTGLAELVAAQFGALDFGEEYNKAQQSCQDFDQLLTQIEDILRDPYNFTYEAIVCLKNVVQLKGEEMKLEIDEKMNRLIDELDKYNEECKQNLRSSDNLARSEKIRLEKEESRKELEKWMATLNELKINETDWTRINIESEEAIDHFKDELTIFKRDLLLQRFGKYQCEIDKHFGKFEVDSLFNFDIINLDSTILVNLEIKQQLINLCEFELNQKWELLYRGSLHGFEMSDFHSKCDYIPKTLTIIKASKSGNIFGGYTEAIWDQTNKGKSDKNAFLFSLLNKDNAPVKVNIANGNEGKAIVSASGYGPVFGYGHDICISDFNNFSKFGVTYALEGYPPGSEKANNFLAGTFYFGVAEIEVFQRL